MISSLGRSYDKEKFMVMIRCTAYLCWVLGFLFFTFPYFYFLSYFYYFYICISIFEFGFSYHSLERAISALLCWDFPLFCFSTTFINHSGIRNDGKGCIPAKKKNICSQDKSWTQDEKKKHFLETETETVVHWRRVH